MQRQQEILSKNPSSVIVHLNSTRQEEMKGSVYCEYLKKIFHFNSEGEMLDAMDDLFDCIAFPQAIFETRNFTNKKNRQIIKKADDFLEESMKELLQNKKTTFVVNVQYRQNATWQGTITWVEQGRVQHFRSALEMLKLMEQANNQGATEVVQWD